jgi:hypothetical protein
VSNASDERLVRRYLAEAIACCPAIADVLRLYLDIRLRRCPLALCPAFHQLRAMADRFPAVRYLSADHPGDRSFTETDAILASAIAADTLAHVQPRTPHANAETVDLLEYVRWDDLALLEHYPSLYAQHAYVRCVQPRTRVLLSAASQAHGWRVRLTTRAPQARVIGKAASVMVNGRVIATWALTATWTTTEAIYESQGRAGADADADEVTIVWPDPGEDRDERIRKVACAMADGAMVRRPIVDVYPLIWGDIQSFTASACVMPRPVESCDVQSGAAV